MTLEESIASKQKEIEIAGSKMPEAMIKIRDAGGFVHRMDVNRVKYTLHIHWNMPRQKELL